MSGAWWGTSWGADRSAWPTASSSGSRLGGMGAVQEGWVEWVQFRKAGRWELLVPVRVPETVSLQGEPWG